jgi:1-deoxy-D-xylulose-5-phosphate reductoisomerase
MMQRKIALLGSTGSIGRNVIDVITSNPDHFKIITLAAGENREQIIQQTTLLKPSMVSVKNKLLADELRAMFPQTSFYYGSAGLLEAVSHQEVNTVVIATNGTSALAATIEAIHQGKRICLANKETLVAAGEIINTELKKSAMEIIPIDSEQSAIFQCLDKNSRPFLKKIILTASGGPFQKIPRTDLSLITPHQALVHPTWSMGQKITIDSATLMNKALEIIESFYLFHLTAGQIEVLIHPQSIVHSLVQFIDGSLLAQLSTADMRIPIQYSLTYPQRISTTRTALNLAEMGTLEFFPVDHVKFPSIQLAFQVLKTQKNSGAIFNTANEIAVEYFIRQKIKFTDIFTVVNAILEKSEFSSPSSVADVEESIRQTTALTIDYINRRF